MIVRPAYRVGLGTAQFGFDYGITNPVGKVAEAEAAAILKTAVEAGVDTLDTARLYGNSEEVIGRNWPPNAHFRIVTKTPKFGGASSPSAAAEHLSAAFETSLAALRCSKVHAFLVHDAQDLLGPLGTALWETLEELKHSGRVEKIGVSVYEPEEVHDILDTYPIDIIQLPFNALDDRLARRGQLKALARAGVEIHARSLFLQGLLLEQPARIPVKFGPVREAVEQLDASFTAQCLGRLEGLLALALSQREIDRFIFGVTSASELEAIILAAQRADRVEGLDVPNLPSIDTRYLNPARWSELERSDRPGEKDAQ